MNDEIIKWEPSDMLEVTLMEPNDFLKIKETLTRIGISSGNTLYQSCHILHKQGRYFIVHFKELFCLDGKYSNLTQEDIGRRNTIGQLLSDWGLVTINNILQVRNKVPLKQIKILSFKDKQTWNLKSKYTIGKVKTAPQY